MARGKRAVQKGETSHQEQEQEEEEEDEKLLGRGVVRFNPTDQQLISSYVANMNLLNPLPPYPAIPAIDAAHFYSVPPMDLVAGRSAAGARQWFFFVGGVAEATRTRGVGNGGAAGSWKSLGDENPIHDSDGQVMGVRIVFTYYSGSQGSRRTYWRMDEYRLPHNNNNNAQWVLDRIRRGREYYRSRRLEPIAEE